MYSSWIPHIPFKYPGSGGSQSAQWVGTHQHPAIPNFDLNIEGRPINFETGSRNYPARIIE